MNWIWNYNIHQIDRKSFEVNTGILTVRINVDFEGWSVPWLVRVAKVLAFMVGFP